MEVFQIQCIIQYLLKICLKCILLPDFEFKAKDNSSQKKHYIYPFSQAGNVIFKDDMPRLPLPWLKAGLHYINLPSPSFIGGGKYGAVVASCKFSKNPTWRCIEEILNGAIIQTAWHML